MWSNLLQNSQPIRCRFLGALLYHVDEDDFLSFVEIGSTQFSAPIGITAPSNGVPDLLSCGGFLSSSVSCMFRQKQKHSIAPQHFLKDPTEPEVQSYLLRARGLRVRQSRWFLMGMGLLSQARMNSRELLG